MNPSTWYHATKLAEKAVAMEPANPHYRETRGQILLLRERWAEAIHDLEIALNGMPDSKAIHQSLAVAYQQMGQIEAAQIHRRLANLR